MTSETKLEIHVTTHSDGFGFSLRPRSRKWLEEHHPIGETVSSVFIGLDKMKSKGDIPSSIWNQVCYLLTSYSLDEINQLGGFKAIYLPEKEIIVDSFQLHV